MSRLLFKFSYTSIRARLLTNILLLVIAPVLMIGFVTTAVSIMGTRQQAYNHLESVATLKEEEIDNWLETLKTNLEIALPPDKSGWFVNLVTDPEIQTENSSSTAQKIAEQLLFEDLQKVIRIPDLFEELFIMDRNGRVVVSTNPAIKGQIYQHQPFFRNGVSGFFTQPPTRFGFPQGIFIFMARPVFDQSGKVVGVLAGRASLKPLIKIMDQRAGLGETGETYLVNSDFGLLTNTHIHTASTNNQPEDVFIQTEGTRSAIQDQADGAGMYRDYNHNLVVGVYHWVPELKIALIAEQDQVEAFQVALISFVILTIIFVASIILAFIMSSMINQSIVTPLEQLSQTAGQIASGQLDQSVYIDRKDEIGVLSNAFNIMTTRLRDLIQDLEKNYQDLELAHTALSGREAHFRSLIENASDVIIILDRDHKISYVSPSTQRLLGYVPETILGAPFEAFLTEDEIPSISRLIQDLKQEGEKNLFLELRIKHQNDSWQLMEAIVNNQLNKPEIMGVVVTLRDIAERKQRERELESLVTFTTALRLAHLRADMMPIILNQFLNLVSLDGAMLALYDPGEKCFKVQNGNGIFAGLMGNSLSLPYISHSHLITPETPMAERDLRQLAYFTDSAWLGQPYYIIHIPLLALEQKIGAIWACRTCRGNQLPQTLSDSDVQLLTAAADIAANAIHRATLFEQTEQRLQNLAALRNIDLIINSSLDLNYTLNALVIQATQQLQVNAAEILLFDPHTHMFTFAAGFGFHAPELSFSSPDLSRGLATRALLERKTVSVRDNRLTDTAMDFGKPDEGFMACFATPLIAKGEIKGILQVFNRSSIDPTPEWIDFLETLAGQAAIAIDNTQLFENLQHSNMELMWAYESTIEGWSRALDLRDRETEGHTQRVTDLTLRLSREMGVDESEIVHIRRGALLHDIGKMGIPDNILLKPGPLTPKEWEEMRKHPEYAFGLLAPIPFLRPALDIPYAHHEKWDGTGYPRALAGTEIPLSARIFAVIDVYDALCSDRPYRAGWNKEKALDYINSQSGTHFDPQVVTTFLELVKRM
jgi:PAS domain S-box-containing protein